MYCSSHSVMYSTDKSVDTPVHCTRLNLRRCVQWFHSDTSISCFFLLLRLFGNSGACSACGQSIPASELVMRAQGNVYHLKVNSSFLYEALTWIKILASHFYFWLVSEANWPATYIFYQHLTRGWC